MVNISIVRDSVFKDIQYKTLLKIFNRLVDEGIVHTVSKGLYCVGNKMVNNKKIISQYASSSRGMIVGYSLFNSIGLTIYNVIVSKQKMIGDFLLKRVDLEFTDEIVD